MAIWRRPACSGCSSRGPGQPERSAASRAARRGRRRERPGPRKRPSSLSSSAASSRWCDPTGSGPASRAACCERGLDRRGAARRGSARRARPGRNGTLVGVPAQPGPQPAKHGVGLLGRLPPPRPASPGSVADTALSTAARISSRSACSRRICDGDALALPDQPEQDVLRADVVVLDRQCLAQRQLQGLLRPRGERDVPARRFLPRPTFAATSSRAPSRVRPKLARTWPPIDSGSPSRPSRMCSVPM